MAFSRFLASILLPWILKCRPRLPSCFPLILLFSTKLILADFIKRFTYSLILAALGSSVLIIKLLMVTSHFGRILSIWCFNDISCSNISLGVSVIALFVPTWIITFCKSSCNKSLRFSLISSIFSPGRAEHVCVLFLTVCFPYCHLTWNLQQSRHCSFLFFCSFLLLSFWFLISYYHLTRYLWFSHFLQ